LVTRAVLMVHVLVLVRRIFLMTTESSIDLMAEFGILEPHEVAGLLKLRHSTVLDLSRRGVLPAFKIGKHWR